MSDPRVVLAFDTATEAIAIGVGVRTGSAGPAAIARIEHLGSRDFEAPRAAMSGLLPAAASLLRELSLTPSDVANVIVGVGPGSFTGVRIGVATAKGFAHGLGVPLFGVGTLDAIAWGISEEWSGTLAVAGDAMRGEVYPALFDVSGDAESRSVRRRHGDRVSKPAVAAGEWVALDEPLLLVGNGLAKYASVFEEALGAHATIGPEGWWAPTGAGLLRAFEASLRANEQSGGDPGAVLPIYTRLSDAEEAERTRAGLGSDEPPRTGVGGPPASGDSSPGVSQS